MHITEVIKQEVIAPDSVKYQGVIIRLGTLHPHVGTAQWHNCKSNLSFSKYLNLNQPKIPVIRNILIRTN